MFLFLIKPTVDLITVALKIQPVVGLLETSVAFLSDPKGDVFWE